MDTQDNQPLELQPIAIALARVTKRLERTKQKHEQSRGEADRNPTQEQRDKDQREAVESRLRQLAAFERRARGNRN